MNEQRKLVNPWLVAVWPGMGHVALNAGIYMLSKLEMTGFAEFDSPDLFDVDHLDVKDGLIQPGRRPRNRFFVRRDPNQRHDLVLFLGEAQPPIGKYAFCRNLVSFAKQLGVERVFTFAAMATQMHPGADSRVFGAATDSANLEELKRLELDILEDGHIGGLNGILLGAAAEADLHGACLLGEMPHIFAQLPFPKASHAILDSFATLAGIDLDLEELAEQGRQVDEQLGELLAQVEAAGEDDEPEEEGFQAAEEEEDEPAPPPIIVKRRTPERIEALFTEAMADRAKAFELKQELDRLHLFKQYEDRFLDLFKKAG
jgi:proteasome assembly chaperone (PAC2) family protein